MEDHGEKKSTNKYTKKENQNKKRKKQFS